jgi:hypothetical protein
MARRTRHRILPKQPRCRCTARHAQAMVLVYIQRMVPNELFADWMESGG